MLCRSLVIVIALILITNGNSLSLSLSHSSFWYYKQRIEWNGTEWNGIGRTNWMNRFETVPSLPLIHSFISSIHSFIHSFRAFFRFVRSFAESICQFRFNELINVELCTTVIITIISWVRESERIGKGVAEKGRLSAHSFALSLISALFSFFQLLPKLK